MRTSLSMLVCLLASPLWAADAKPPTGWNLRTINGFTVLVHDDVLAQPVDRWQRKPLAVLETEFDDLKRVAGPRLSEMLRQIPVWVRWHSQDMGMPNAVAFYYGYEANVLARAGREPLMTNSIEIVSLKTIGQLRPPGSKFQQIITLHEMAHAIHHRLLGFDAPEVKSAFQTAVERRLYDSVADRTGRTTRAYARTNANEYFAEISCAYLDSCFTYPHTYSDLKIHDPIGFALMESVWKRPETFAGRVARVETPRFSANQPIAGTIAKGVAVGAEAERDAFKQLDRAKVLLKESKNAEAKKVLETLIKTYPTSIAAGDARKTLQQVQ